MGWNRFGSSGVHLKGESNKDEDAMSKRGADTQREGWSADFQSTDAPMDGPQLLSADKMINRK